MPKLSQRQSSMSQPLTNLHVLDLHSSRNQGIKRNSTILRCQFQYSTTRLHVWWQLHLSPPPRRGTRQRRHQEFHKMLTGNWGNYVHLTVGPTLVWQANLHTLFQLKMMRETQPEINCLNVVFLLTQPEINCLNVVFFSSIISSFEVLDSIFSARDTRDSLHDERKAR